MSGGQAAFATGDLRGGHELARGLATAQGGGANQLCGVLRTEARRQPFVTRCGVALVDLLNRRHQQRVAEASVLPAEAEGADQLAVGQRLGGQGGRGALYGAGVGIASGGKFAGDAELHDLFVHVFD